MKFAIAGSLGNVSRRLIEKLKANGHLVTVITSNPQKVKEIEKLNARAAVGSVEDLDFLINVFNGADAVYTMIPPNFSVPDYKAFTIRVRENYAKAIEKVGVKFVVNLSSSGSALAGTKPLTEYQNLEESLNKLQDINVIHLRPGGLYSNFYGSIELIKHQGILGNNFDETATMILTHPHDISNAAFEALNTLSFKGINIKYIVSDKKNGKEIAQILGTALGKDNLQWIQFTDKQLLEGLTQNGFSKQAAQDYVVDMGIAIRDGVLANHYKHNKHEVVGNISFKEFAKEFAITYANS